jgi:hypothetical protein
VNVLLELSLAIFKSTSERGELLYQRDKQPTAFYIPAIGKVTTAVLLKDLVDIIRPLDSKSSQLSARMKELGSQLLSFPRKFAIVRDRSFDIDNKISSLLSAKLESLRSQLLSFLWKAAMIRDQKFDVDSKSGQ